MRYEPYTSEDVKRASAQKNFTVISCFAGGGGSSTGYRISGGDILLVNEFVEEAIASYRKNYPDTPVLVDDIKKYSGDDFLRMAGINAGELDILDGSPPCSAFSTSSGKPAAWTNLSVDNRKSYFDDNGEIVREGAIKTSKNIKKYSDGKIVENIEDLFLEFIRVAKDIKPKVIIAENVKGITLGESRTKLVEFINAFESIGYQVTYKVMNAANFGVPQNRLRTIFICVRDDVADAIGLNVLNLTSLFPDELPGIVSLEEAIGDVDNDPEEVKMLRDFYEGSFQKKFLDHIPFRPMKTLKASDRAFIEWNPNLSCFNMKRPSPYHPSPTITQMGQKMGMSGVFHYGENRKFTIKELKIIMSLPEDYILTGTFDQQAERIGRMVAPKMMAAVAKSIHEKVLKPYKETTA